jgi:PAS domain S-box-containing protein
MFKRNDSSANYVSKSLLVYCILCFFLIIFSFSLLEFFSGASLFFLTTSQVVIRIIISFFISLLFFLFFKNRAGQTLPVFSNKNMEEIISKIFYSNLIPATISKLDTGELVAVSDAFCSIIEFTREELIGKNPTQIWVNPEERFRVVDQIKQNGSIQNERILFRTKSGRIGHSLLSGEVILIDRDCHILLVLSEITNLVEYENSLEESRAILRGILDASLDVIALVDNEGKFIFSNKKLSQRWNIPPSNFIGKSAADILPQPIFDSRMKIIRTAMEEKQSKYFIDTYDGKWFENTISPISDRNNKVEKAAMYSREITESMKAQQALKNSEAELRAIFSSMQDVIVVLDKNGSYIKIAPTRPELLYKPSKELLNKTLHEVFPKEKADYFQDAVTKALSEQKTISLDYNLVISGKEIWFECAVTPIDDDNVLWAAKDITERKIAEEKLIESEKRYHTLATISPVGIFRTDGAGFTTYVNPRWMEISGMNSSEALGNGWLDAVYPEDRERITNGWEDATGKHSSSIAEYRFLHKNGDIHWVIGLATPEYDDSENIIGYVGTTTDITERKTVERALKESERKVRKMIDESTIGIVLSRDDGFLIESNKAFTDAIGYSIEEINRLPYNVTTPEKYLEIDKQLFTKLKIDNRFGPYEKEYIRRDGSLFPVSCNGWVVESETGERIVWILIEDITERKRAEEALINSQKEYRQLSAYLQRVREEERASLAREMHDEFGQLLTSIKLNLSFMKRQYLTAIDKKNRDAFESDLKVAFSHVDSAINSVRRLITELRPELLDKLGLIQALEWFIEEFEKNTKIKCSFECEFDVVAFDKNTQLSIFRITQESLTNILKHSRAANVKIFFGVRNECTVLEISDDGKGFDLTPDNSHQSYGLLGMKERASFIDGNLIVSSKLNEGTTIRLTLHR